MSPSASHHPAAAAAEIVTLEGTVLAPQAPLAAPLSGRPCVIYQARLTLWQWLVEGAAGSSCEVAGVPFLLAERSSGAPVLIDPRRAQLTLGRTLTRRVRIGRDQALDARVEQLYLQLARRWPKRGTVRCREQRLPPGERVWLAGRLVVRSDVRGDAAGYRQPPRMRLLEAEVIVALRP